MGESTAFRGEFGHSFYVPVIAIYRPVIARNEAIHGLPRSAHHDKLIGIFFLFAVTL